MPKTSRQLSPNAILAGTFLIFLVPFLLVISFPSQLDRVMEKSSYLVFHNVAEFFSIMVSLSVFSVGWYTYDQSKDQRALFLGGAFLVVGLLDFMHTMGNAAMPAFLTPNSTNKSTQFWICARLLDASAFLASAFLTGEKVSRWISKKTVMILAVLVTGVIFTAVTFFPAYLPATAIQGVGLTPLKRYLELLVILLLVCSWVAYWKKMVKTGDRVNLYFLCAFIICIFSEAVFASYKTGFDTYNVLGHIYKVAAFYLIYKAIFASAVRKPYLHLSEANEKLRRLNRLYTVLSETNKVIAHATDRDSLFSEVCSVATRYGGFRMASIGVLDHDSRLVKPVAWSGHNDGYLDDIAISVKTTAEGLEPTGSVIREGGLKVCSDITSDPAGAPWRAEGESRGYRSSAAIALNLEDKVVGALTLYACEKDYFDAQMTELLQQMARDISFALDGLEREARRREAERALQEETMERLRVMEALHQKNQLLIQQSRLAAMGEMINNIAHQWRQPLNNVGLILQEMQMVHDLGQFDREYLMSRTEAANDLVLHMSQTIDDFRNFLRPDKEKVPFEVGRTVNETLSLIKESFKNLGIEVVVGAAAVPAVHGYPNEFSQVLLNLLANARDAFVENKVAFPRLVTISTFVEGERVVVTIADNAGGIPEEVMDKIFDPYFTTKGAEQGTGIGLYMSKTIIDQNMKGSLTARNTGAGAEFRIELPVGAALPPFPCQREGENESALLGG